MTIVAPPVPCSGLRMDPTLLLNVVSIVLALAALTVSGRLAYRQVLVAERANNVPVVLELFARAREKDFVDTQVYARERLRLDQDPDAGFTGLPNELRHRLLHLTWFYDDLGKLVAHGIVSEDVVLGAFGAGVSRTWQALAPFVYGERTLRTTEFQAYFEDLAARAAIRSPADVHEALGMKRLPPVL